MALYSCTNFIICVFCKNNMNKTINFFLDKDKFDVNEINKYDGLKYSEEGYMKYRICYT